MLYEFKCQATGTVVMTGPVAERLLRIVGKQPGPQGIVTTEQFGPAITALQAAVDQEEGERSASRAQAPATAHDDDDATGDAARSVSLRQQAWPLIEMMREAGKAGQPVTWGV